jgi:hypothetical protein
MHEMSSPSLTDSIGLVMSFFFQKKKQKAFVLLRRSLLSLTSLAKRSPGTWGWLPASKNTHYLRLADVIGLVVFFFFQKKKQKR